MPNCFHQWQNNDLSCTYRISSPLGHNIRSLVMAMLIKGTQRKWIWRSGLARFLSGVRLVSSLTIERILKTHVKNDRMDKPVRYRSWIHVIPVHSLESTASRLQFHKASQNPLRLSKIALLIKLKLILMWPWDDLDLTLTDLHAILICRQTKNSFISVL